MPTIKRFEDIQAWQLAREVVKSVYSMTQLQLFNRDYGLVDQIRRSAGSVMHNIAEGFDSGMDSEFIRFLGYARRSAAEVQSQLYIALDLKYIDNDQFSSLYAKLESTKRKVNALISYLHNSKRKTLTHSIKDEPSTYITEDNTTNSFDQTDQSNHPDHSDYLDQVDHLDQLDHADHADHSDQSDHIDQ